MTGRRVGVKVPKLGLTIESGAVVEWTVKVGDSVSKGDVLGQIEADKAVYDLEAPESGTVVEILAPVDTDVQHPVGTELATIEVHHGD